MVETSADTFKCKIRRALELRPIKLRGLLACTLGHAELIVDVEDLIED